MPITSQQLLEKKALENSVQHTTKQKGYMFQSLPSDLKSTEYEMNKTIVPRFIIEIILKANDFETIKGPCKALVLEANPEYIAFNIQYEREKKRLLSNPISLQTLLNFMKVYSCKVLAAKHTLVTKQSFLQEYPEVSYNLGNGKCTTCVSCIDQICAEQTKSASKNLTNLNQQELNEVSDEIHERYEEIKKLLPNKEQVFLQLKSTTYNDINNIYKEASILIQISSILKSILQSSAYKNKEIENVILILSQKSIELQESLFNYLSDIYKLVGHELQIDDIYKLPLYLSIIPIGNKEFNLLALSLLENIDLIFYNYGSDDSCCCDTKTPGSEEIDLLEKHLGLHCTEDKNFKLNVSKLIILLQTLKMSNVALEKYLLTQNF